MNTPTHVLCLDFCDTLTTTKTIQWADRRLMKEAAVVEMEGWRQRLLPKLNDGIITQEEMDSWTFRTFEIYAEQGVTRPQIIEAMRGLPLREGITALLGWACEMKIPAAVISGSCADFIDIVLTDAGLREFVTHVHATRLTYSDDRVTGAVRETMVTNFNKGTWARSFAAKHGVPDTRIIGIGDSNNDVSLAGDNGFLVGITASEAQAKKLLPRFNRVMVTPTLHDVLPVLRGYVAS